MIVLKMEKVNTNYEEKIRHYEEIINLPLLKCPHCGSSKYNYYGSYIRNVVYVEKEKKIETTIEIKRIRCECGKTHSIIPDFLIPYKQYALETINNALKLRIAKKKKLKEIFEKMKIDRQLVRKWEKIFCSISNKISTVLSIYIKEEMIEKIDNNIISDYYKEFKEIYMMKRYVNLNYIST